MNRQGSRSSTARPDSRRGRLRLLVSAALALTICLTAASPASALKRIAAAGDIACDPADRDFDGGAGSESRCRQRATSDLLVGRKLNRVLTLGDNQYESGLLDAFEASYAQSWGRLLSRTRPAIGNHEYYGGGSGYFDYFNGVGRRTGRAGNRERGYYTFTVGRWRLFALNSNCGIVACERGSAQQRWLRRRLHERTKRRGRRCELAYLHHPRWSSGLHGSDPAVQDLWSTLARNRVELLLAGHEHDYERFAPLGAAGRFNRRGTVEIIAGTGGKDLRPFEETERGSRVRITDAFGVLLLKLRHRSVRWRFLSTAGEVLDRGRRRCR